MEEELVLIQSPTHAIQLLGFKNTAAIEYNKKDLLKDPQNLPQNSLLSFYLGGDAKKGTSRKYSHLDEVRALAKKCKELVNTADREQQIHNTFLFLTWLSEIETTTDTYNKALTIFAALNFRTENTGNLHGMCTTLRDKLNAHLPPTKKISFMRAPAAAKKGTAKVKHKLSVAGNLKKDNFNQVSPHVFLGKIPVFAFEVSLRETCKPKLIISAVHPSEFSTSLNKKAEHQVSKPSLWVQHQIKQVFLDKFIDFQEACRKNSAYSKELLDKVYTDIYYAVAYMDAVIKENCNVYVHCKAGKGRSPTYLVVYYLFHPEELSTAEQLAEITNIDAAEKAEFCATWKEKLQKLDVAWKKMTECGASIEINTEGETELRECIKIIHEIIVLSRSHIDPIGKIENAAFDCYCFIKQNEKQLSQKTHIQHFFPEPQNENGKTLELRRANSQEDM